MKLITRIGLGFKALIELGPTQVGLFGLYQLGLRTGHYQRQLTAALSRLNTLNVPNHLKLHPCLPTLPEKDILRTVLGNQINYLFEQAEEIVDGKVRLFGGEPVPLVLTSPEPLVNWTRYDGGNNRIGDQDIKFIWEPARFGWACTLARAYYLNGNEQYAQVFWDYTQHFLTSNPPFWGPHWTSAQEAAIRLINLAFAVQVFAQSRQATTERLDNLTRAIAVHAERIPPTMVYARSQHNNHLITEALGLYTASALLPEHPLAAKWHHLGWKWLQYAFRTQIAADGTYTQHSTNYHRLMLQAALWMYAIHDNAFPNEKIPPATPFLLEASTQSIWQMLDPGSGRVPNLGHNDGAYILPLSVSPYHDYQPVIYAAACKFLRTKLKPAGPWCEMMLWLCQPLDQTLHEVGSDLYNVTGMALQVNQARSVHGQHNPFNTSWALFRVEYFRARPAHADQLHVDLWWRGLNLAQDPGTYLYNSASPWDNSLTSAFVHNTVTVDGREFMLRAGRFLYLDWAQAKVTSLRSEGSDEVGSITAYHNGYRKMGVTHSRKLTTFHDGHWEIFDRVTGPTGPTHTIRLHWLLPDWEYEIRDTLDKMDFPWYEVRIRSPYGWVSLKIGDGSLAKKIQPAQTGNLQLVRAGEILFGSGNINPITGWTSPTYGDKIPALACILEISQSLPVELKSEWMFPNES